MTQPLTGLYVGARVPSQPTETREQRRQRYLDDYERAFAELLNDHMRRRGAIFNGTDPRTLPGQRYQYRRAALLRGEGRRWAFAQKAFQKTWDEKAEKEYALYVYERERPYV